MMIFKTVGGLRDSLDDSLWDKNGNRESSNIHQEMYELATKNWTTVAETQGGSENFRRSWRLELWYWDGTIQMSNSEDWRYSHERMKLREEVLKILLSKYGGQMEGVVPKYSTKGIYECADWVSQGHTTSFGVVKYFEVYYAENY